MSTSLVTGGTGFIGSHLAARLAARGETVRCLARPTSNRSPLKAIDVQWCEADLTGSEQGLLEAVSGTAAVYHVAGVTHTTRPQEQWRVNCDGVQRLLSLCARQVPPPRFILVSSLAAAGPIERGNVRRESDPPRPISRYGRSKLAGEQAARKWAERVPITIVRPAMVFGPRDRNMLPLFRMIDRWGIHLVPALRPPPLSLIHVEDLVELMTRCADAGQRLAPAADDHAVGEGCYFATAPEHPTYGELGRLIGQAVGRSRVRCLTLPGLMPWMVAGVNQWLGRLRGRSSSLRIDKIREAKASSWACSGDAAQRDLDFAPANSLLEQFTHTIHWYRQQRWL